MNKTRMLTIFNNLLLELEEAKMLDNHGVNKVRTALCDNIIVCLLLSRMMIRDDENNYLLCVAIRTKNISDLQKIKNYLTRHNAEIIGPNHVYERDYTLKRVNRIKKLVTIIPNSPTTIGNCYRVVRRRKYYFSYKTFQRDIAQMVINGSITVKKQTGSGGNTTIITKVK